MSAVQQQEVPGLRQRSGDKSGQPSSEVTPKPITKEPSANVVSALVRWVFFNLPQLLIAGSFAASAVLMKLLPYFGLVDKTFKKAAIKNFKGFVAVPHLNTVFVALNIGHKQFMLVLGIAHLIIVAILVLPKSRWTAQVAGFYTMAVMLGAEYCIRNSAFVPPGVPVEFQHYAKIGGTVFHVLLFVSGFLLLFPRLNRFSSDSLGICSRFLGLFHRSQAESSTATAPVQDAAVPATTQAAPVAAVPKAVTPVAPAGSRKRDSTPPPTKATEQPRRGGAALRGSAAMNH